ncbi:hypothetical protein Bca4012_007899 [Brassica carinata]
MVHLGPVDATILIQLRIRALGNVATSHVFVINRSLFEDLEVRFESFLDWIVSGNFDILHSILSKKIKFVSILVFLRNLCEVLVYQFAHCELYNVANIVVFA